MRWAALAVLLAVHAFLLAGVFNPSPHSGGDNAGYLTLAYSLLDRGEYLDLYDPAEPAHTKYPPGFPVVLGMAMLLGARTWSQFKLISALGIFATVGLSVAWAWRRRGWEFGLGIGVILAFANALLYASQWVLSDPMFLALTLAALVAFDRVAEAWDTSPPRDNGRVWLSLGIAATVVAFFTRSAGLPLVVAAAGWLLLRRRTRAFAALAVALGVPALLWWIRDQALGGPGYTGEFWLINPYQPDLGQAGFVDLVGRVAANATSYVGAHIPIGFVGRGGAVAAVLGVALVAFATQGWARRLRSPGVAELFAPLYLGLILLWPEVWSGDRFALPLFPLLIFYAGESLLQLLSRVRPTARAALVGAAMVLVLVPSALTWRVSARQSEICREQTQRGAFACYAPRMQEFVAAANWTTANLPQSSVVLSRKPRMFYVVSGTPSRIFPLSPEPDGLVAAADSATARFVVLDYLDNLAAFYLIPSLEQRTGIFCTAQSFGGDDRGIATELLGLRTELMDDVNPAEGEDGTLSVTLSRCPAEMFAADPAQSVSRPSTEPGLVPLLSGLDP